MYTNILYKHKTKTDLLENGTLKVADRLSWWVMIYTTVKIIEKYHQIMH